MSKNINIAACVDETMFPGLVGLIGSLLKNLNIGTRLNFFLVTDNEIENKYLYSSLHKYISNHSNVISLHKINVDLSPFNDFYLGGHFSKLTYARLLLPDLLPDIHKLLYLDVDIIVRRPIEYLFHVDLSGYYIAAVQSHKMEAIKTYETVHKRFHTHPSAAYFNAGVLLMNLKKMRNNNFLKRIIAVGKELKGIDYYVDQDLLNVVCANKWKPLNKEWNSIVVLEKDRPNYYHHSSNIVHTTGKYKPWHFYKPSNFLISTEYFSPVIDYWNIIEDMGINLPMSIQQVLYMRKVRDIYRNLRLQTGSYL